MDEYTPEFALVRHQNRITSYLRRESLEYFLRFIQKEQKFTYKDARISRDFSSGDFYVVICWLRDCDFLKEVRGGWLLTVSHEQIKQRFNEAVDQCKFKQE